MFGEISAKTWTVNGVRWQSIYVIRNDGKLYEHEWNGFGWRWVAHGKPSAVTTVQGVSSTVYRSPGTPPSPNAVTPVAIARHVFVRGSDQKLYVRYTGDNGANWAWADQTTPYGGPNIVGSTLASLAYYSR